MMRYISFLIILLLGLTSQAQQKILIKNITIIDGDAGITPRNGSILIVKDKIAAIYGPKSPVFQSGTKIIDGTGKYLVPGLIDAHVHLATGDLSDLKKARSTTDSIVGNLLRHGITTVRDMAGNAPYLAHYKTALATGKIAGPDIYYAAQFAGPAYFKMRANGQKDAGEEGNTPWYRRIVGTADIKPAIAEAKKAGVSGIKIYANHSPNLVHQITAEAHLQGLQAWAHGAVFPAKPMDVARAGVNSMSHANDLVFQQLEGDTINISNAWSQLYKGMKLDTSICDQLLLTMKRNNIFLDPTLFHAENNKMINAALITKRAHKFGVKIVTGTDWIYPTKNEPVPLLDEMKLLVQKCGLSHTEAIQAATLNAARATGLKDRGRVRKGQRADLLILNSNPLSNLEALFNPAIVLKAGKEMF